MVIFSFILILISAVIPGIVWLIFFLKEDINPEPKRMLMKVFGIGAIVTFPVIALQVIFQGVFNYLAIPAIFLVLFFSFSEEFFKFFGAWLGVSDSKYFDEPIDAMIYMIVAAVGFATVENFLVLLNLLSVSGSLYVSSIADVLILRFVGATFLHIISSGIVGFYWSRHKTEKNKKLIIWGIFSATLIHVFFNVLVVVFEKIDYLIYPSLFLIFMSAFVFNDFDKLKRKSIIIKK
ncbi:MAG: PrsW family glutamic-type intramembrane protease [Candidatus Paceibacterota bacterium]